MNFYLTCPDPDCSWASGPYDEFYRKMWRGLDDMVRFQRHWTTDHAPIPEPILKDTTKSR